MNPWEAPGLTPEERAAALQDSKPGVTYLTRLNIAAAIRAAVEQEATVLCNIAAGHLRLRTEQAEDELAYAHSQGEKLMLTNSRLRVALSEIASRCGEESYSGQIARAALEMETK